MQVPLMMTKTEGLPVGMDGMETGWLLLLPPATGLAATGAAPEATDGGEERPEGEGEVKGPNTGAGVRWAGALPCTRPVPGSGLDVVGGKGSILRLAPVGRGIPGEQVFGGRSTKGMLAWNVFSSHSA